MTGNKEMRRLSKFCILNTNMNKEELNHIRHTLSHLLASAVRELYPHAKPTLGPAIDTGFYYDFDFDGGDKPAPKDLQKIEQKMRELLKKWESMQREVVTDTQALAFFKNNPYKVEMITDIAKGGSPITFYHSGASGDTLTTENALFTDLCEGGHVETPNKDLRDVAFKLDRIAGAYWRGDENNTMLTRIYGLAFENKEALVTYETNLEEAKKRDHRKLGKELDLFTFSELVGPGLPMWTPRGAIVRHELDSYIWELRQKHGYSRVTIPHITKKDLYVTSGHWEKFADELFKVATREGKEYALKPMNCPHHTQIFARKPHSYREMPQRYAETTMVYRDEQSGELGGLTRVLSITQDDSHVFCRSSQVKEEFNKIWDIVDTLYSTFNFKLRVRLSFHDPKTMEKYLGDTKVWENSEKALKEIAIERKADYFEGIGEAAMYGPKLDFMATDSIGREHQVATIQLDMNLPERFDLSCINEQGESERIVMIHAAIMGSIERFTAVLIEHLAGNFPLWLAPVQLRVLPIAEAHQKYAKELFDKLIQSQIRVELRDTGESFGKRVRASKVDKVPYFICVGDKEIESGTLRLEAHDGTVIEKNIDDTLSFLTEKIKDRSL
ncbi:MAG: Threonine-tRNA ligase [Parcubacteria group bacterium GW2011_GWD2_42_14]|nr:MAG: Threonine-tRNA ligase [Parcubacteria group bacterium GW2011_GWD2_42_14]